MKLTAHIKKRWCPFEKRHSWTLQGTGSVLDGTVLATPYQREPFPAQVRVNLTELNSRRKALNLPPVALNERVR